MIDRHDSPGGLSLGDLIDQLGLHDAERLKAMVDERSGVKDSALGECTPETDMLWLTDVSRIESNGKTWAKSLLISGPLMMISIGQYYHPRQVH
jgi:hypothetical protein